MSFNFRDIGGPGLEEDFVLWLIEKSQPSKNAHFKRLYEYYSNKITPHGNYASLFNERTNGYIQSQEQGLPTRITGLKPGTFFDATNAEIRRKEVVIENDIGWRIDSMNDFLFGKGIRILSKANEPEKAKQIEAILRDVIEANGGSEFLMSLVLLGSVYGFVDVVVRLEDLARASRAGLEDAHEKIVLDLVPAYHSLPVLSENDFRQIDYYLQHFQMQTNRTEASNLLSRIRRNPTQRKCIEVTEVFSPCKIQRYHDGELISELPNRIGRVPVVHIQNISRPNSYEGASDVEPLIPLQDELNTRLSDRASRITMQSFKMYLVKGIDPVNQNVISPGRLWYTWNDDATIEEFGGDSSCPGEDNHIADIREAMDKLSGVTPLAAGVIRSKIGNLTSAVALKMTLMGMLSKNERRKQSYGAGLRRISEMILEACNISGLLETTSQERKVEVVFEDPLPENTTEKLNEALLKKEVGMPEEEVFRELGVSAGSGIKY